MRISDWSSDVCSSDLRVHQGLARAGKRRRHEEACGKRQKSRCEREAPALLSHIAQLFERIKAATRARSVQPRDACSFRYGQRGLTLECEEYFQPERQRHHEITRKSTRLYSCN